jgi:hypothetical protein
MKGPDMNSPEARAGYGESSELGVLFGAFVRKQSYLNLLYLILSFPLGIFYFVLVVVGISVGFSLLIVLIGIPLLGLTLAAVRGLGAWERQLAIWLLDADIPRRVVLRISWKHPWRALKRLVRDKSTWKALAFLLLKLPLGVVSFVACVVLGSVSAALLLCPLTYRFVPVNFYGSPITTPEEALLCLVAGLVLALISIHVLNALAALWRVLAVALLNGGAARTLEPTQSGPIVIP